MEVWGGNHAVDQGVIMPGLDLWVRSEPVEGHAQGGDVHSVSSCGTGRISRMVLADVSGHGETAGDLARSLRTLMRRFVNFVDQTRFVSALNNALVDDASGRFATSIAMTFFAPSRRLDVCNAGHPRPLLRRARTGRWSVLAPAAAARPAPRHAAARDAGTATDGPSSRAPRNLPLGVLEPTEYAQFGLRLEVGDLVLAYTDALLESRGTDGTMLGEEGLLRLVESIDASKPERFISALVRALQDRCGDRPPDDDLTVLLLRHNGLASRASRAASFAATLRFLGVALRSLVPVGDRPPIPWPEFNRVNVLGALSRRVAESWDGPTGAARLDDLDAAPPNPR